MKLDVEKDVKVKVKLMNGEDLSAIVTLIFLESFEVRGFTIRPTKFKENSKNFFLAPPANRTSKGNWIKLFFMNNKELWDSLEKYVLSEFDITQTEAYFSKDNNS